MKKTDGRKLGESELQIKRNQVAKIYRSTGGNAAQTARQLGVSRYFVIKWIKRFSEEWEGKLKNGFSTKYIYLYPKKRGRRVKFPYYSISKEILSDAKTIIEKNAPNQVGINSLLWTERAVKKLFRLKYNIDFNYGYVYQFIQDLGFLPHTQRKYRKIEKLVSAHNRYGYEIINGYIYFLHHPGYPQYTGWAWEVEQLVRKQRKK